MKNVHGIYASTSVQRYNQPQAGLPTRMSEERRYREVSHRPQDRMEEQDTSEEEEEGEETRTHPVEGLYTSEQIDDMRRKKCRILDCVLDTFPEHLKTKAKSMCDILKMQRSFVHSPEPRNCN